MHRPSSFLWADERGDPSGFAYRGFSVFLGVAGSYLEAQRYGLLFSHAFPVFQGWMCGRNGFWIPESGRDCV